MEHGGAARVQLGHGMESRRKKEEDDANVVVGPLGSEGRREKACGLLSCSAKEERRSG